MDINLSQFQRVTIHLRGVTKAQKVGHFKQPPKWELQAEDVVKIVPSVDGTSCVVRSSDTVGNTVLTVDDIDNPLSAPLTFNIVVQEAAITELQAEVDEPEDDEDE